MTTATMSTRRARTEGARIQNVILFLTAVLLALAVVGTLAGRAHASIWCATKSIATATNSCGGSAPAENQAPAVTFVFER
jgi:hypothetical protein